VIWVQHDLYKNFLRSFNSGDINLSLDIFRSEVSDLLTNKSNDFFALLDKLKIKYKKSQSYEELLDIVLREIKTNEIFVRGLAFLIGQNNEVNKKNPKISWVKLLDAIKRGIEQIAVYFEQNPRQEFLFRKKALDMVELKSSVIGNDSRLMKKKDNTLAWVLGLTALGVASYLIYRHFNRIEEARLRAESFNHNKPEVPMLENGGGLNSSELKEPVFQHINDPSYNVSETVLIPEVKPQMQQIPQMQNQNANVGNNVPSGVQINVQPMQAQPNNIGSIQQNNVGI